MPACVFVNHNHFIFLIRLSFYPGTLIKGHFLMFAVIISYLWPLPTNYKIPLQIRRQKQRACFCPAVTQKAPCHPSFYHTFHYTCAEYHFKAFPSLPAAALNPICVKQQRPCVVTWTIWEVVFLCFGFFHQLMLSFAADYSSVFYKYWGAGMQFYSAE